MGVSERHSIDAKDSLALAVFTHSPSPSLSFYVIFLSLSITWHADATVVVQQCKPTEVFLSVYVSRFFLPYRHLSLSTRFQVVEKEEKITGVRQGKVESEGAVPT